MAMSKTELRNLSFGNMLGKHYQFTGDASAKYIDTGIGKPLLGAILTGCSADPVMVELNTQDGSAASNGSLYWDTAIGSSATVDYIVLYSG